jgi:hypothetical protein
MRMNYGWIRIYLFYGLIFFLLGFAGSFLENGWDESWLAQSFNIFLADLGKYMNPVNSGDNPVMVMAGRSKLSIRLFYPACAAEELGVTPDRIRSLLEGYYHPVIIESFQDRAQYQQYWSRWSDDEPDRIRVGINVISYSDKRDRYQVDLGLAFPRQLQEIASRQMENALGGAASYTLRHILRNSRCRRVYYWNQAGSLKPVLLKITKALAEIPGLWQDTRI